MVLHEMVQLMDGQVQNFAALIGPTGIEVPPVFSIGRSRRPQESDGGSQSHIQFHSRSLAGLGIELRRSHCLVLSD